MLGLLNKLTRSLTSKNKAKNTEQASVCKSIQQTSSPADFKQQSNIKRDSQSPINTAAKADLSDSDDAFYQQLFPTDKIKNPIDLPQKLIIQVVEDHLNDQNHRSKIIPRLPAIIPQLIRSLKDPKTSSQDYVRIIRRDPSMSAGVLKLANSVYFNPVSQTITSIEVAVIKLGIDGLRSVLSAVVMQPVIQQKTRYFSHFGQKLWLHSLATAVICELLAKNRGIDPYKAYLLGLTHNIGKVTIFSELCQQLKTLPSEQRPSRDAFIPLLQKRSEKLSYEIAKDWQLPDEIISALKQQASVANNNNLGPISQLLFEAKKISTLYLLNQEKLSRKPIPKDLQQQLTQQLALLQLPENTFSLLENLHKGY